MIEKILPEKEIGQNLKKLVTSLGLTNQAFAEQIGEKKAQTISNYINCTGGRNPSNIVTKLVSIGVNGNWYLTGKGKMFVHETHEASEKDIENDDVLKQEARKIQLLFDRGLIEVGGKRTEEGQKLRPVTTANVTEVPHYTHRIAAGTPADSSSPAEKIALPSLLIKHPHDTYAVTVTGDSMLGANIEEGDILIVDTAIEPTNKSIVIASINGEQTVKRLLISGKTVSLAPENHKYQTTEITGDTDFRTLGVVTWIIRETA